MAGELVNGTVANQLARLMNLSQAAPAEEACLAVDPGPELLDGRFHPLLDRLIPAMFVDQPEVATGLQRRLVLTAQTGNRAGGGVRGDRRPEVTQPGASTAQSTTATHLSLLVQG
jgi:hypothetical protein